MRKKKSEILAYQARLGRLDPWATARSVFSVGLVLTIVGLIAVVIGWLAIDQLGVWDKINSSIASILGDDAAFSVQQYLSLKNSIIIASLFAAVNLVGITLVSIVAAYAFNAISAFTGGVPLELWNNGKALEVTVDEKNPVKNTPEPEKDSTA